MTTSAVKITPDLFKEHENASHDDVLYAPHKTPEIRLPEARMVKGGRDDRVDSAL